MMAVLPESDAVWLVVLRGVEQRVLWLSTAIADHTSRRRPNHSGLKVGRQASSASMATIMTALWFDALDPHDQCRSSGTPRRCCTQSTTCLAAWTSNT